MMEKYGVVPEDLEEEKAQEEESPEPVKKEENSDVSGKHK
jgi:hypothetical protein